MVGAIQTKLQAIIAANQLQRFYPPQNIAALAARVDQRVNFADLAARWGGGGVAGLSGRLMRLSCTFFGCIPCPLRTLELGEHLYRGLV